MKNGVIVSVVVSAVVLLLYAACPLDRAQVMGPGGGAVFYDKGNYDGGWRYVECAPEDAGKLSGTDGSIDFTEAAKTAANYTHGGFNDWRLPTDKEFKAMFKNLMHNGSYTFNDDAVGYVGLSINKTIYYLTSEGSAYYGKKTTSTDKNGKETISWNIEQGSDSYQEGCSYKVRPVRGF